MFLAGFSCTEADLIERSPIKPPADWRLGALTLIRELYLPGENLNIVLDCSLSKDGKARPDGRGLTIERNLCLERRRDGFPMAKNGGWLRMNPIDGVGVNDANVTKFRYALVEFDKIPLELQFSLFGKLPLPVGAILTSGGRSVHAWVRVDAFDIEEYRELTAEFLAFLLRFGADGKNKNPSRLSRLPGVTRTTGASGDGAQKLIYCNPKPTNTPIFLCDTPF